MKKRCTLIIVTISLLLLIQRGNAQEFNIVKATRQNWAGGVVGRSGTTYIIVLETKSDKMIPDTIWINGNVYPVKYTPNGEYNKTMDTATHMVKFSFLMSETHFRTGRPHPQITDTASEPKKLIRPTPGGTALISYRRKKKQHFFTVKSFTELKQLNYP